MAPGPNPACFCPLVRSTVPGRDFTVVHPLSYLHPGPYKHPNQVKAMARPLRLQFPGAIYHVMARGNARQPIFLIEEDHRRFLENIGPIARRFDWRIWAYCLMGNHYHLVVETYRATLSRGMRQVNGVYAQAFNRRHRRVGHVFQGRFQAILVDRHNYMLELCRYIVLNPVRAGLVREPDAWPWSSYPCTMGHSLSPEWLATTEILALFGRTPRRARLAYSRFVSEGIESADPSARAARPGVALGDETYLRDLMQRAGPSRPSSEIPRRGRVVLGLGDIQRQSETRNDAIRAAYASGCYTLKEIGAFFGLGAAQVSRIARDPRGESAPS